MKQPKTTVVPIRQESKREKFKKIGDKRMTATLKSIKRLGNLGNRSTYEFDDDDVRKMITALNEAVADVSARMKDHRKQVGFEF
jgi:hypothetical protein